MKKCFLILLAIITLVGCKHNYTNPEPIPEVEKYDSVRIGNQVWMIKNLNLSHYRNGDPVISVRGFYDWPLLKVGAWCYYDNEPAHGGTYGKIYNWYAVNDPRGLAPEGWHIPSKAEWQALIDYLGGMSVAGGKLKEEGLAHWKSPNKGATNSTGFTALPGGYRYGSGPCSGMSDFIYFWSSTESTELSAYCFDLDSYNPYLSSLPRAKEYGCYIRCIKD